MWRLPAAGEQCARQDLPELIDCPRTLFLVVAPHDLRLLRMAETGDLPAAVAQDAAVDFIGLGGEEKQQRGSRITRIHVPGRLVEPFLAHPARFELFLLARHSRPITACLP